jgi:hypothetical protein
MRVLPVTLLLVLVLCLVAIGERPAEAYIDPGSASYLFQLLVGGALGAVFLIRTYWNRLVTGVRSLVSRDAARTP